MVKIERITVQKKNKHRYNIFLADKEKSQYGFSVDEAILVEYQLRKGMELSESLVEELQQEDQTYQSYALAIRYLSYRMRSKKEMSDYLLSKEIDENAIPQIIDRLVKEGLLDDYQFAEAFVNTRLTTTNKGPLLVKKELQAKGVASIHIEATLTKYTYEQQYEKAMKWAKKKLKTSKRDSWQKQQQKTQGNLIQKGFTNDVITDVLKELEQGQETRDEWDALLYQGDKLIKRHMKKCSGYELRQKVKTSLYRQGFSLTSINQYLAEQMSSEEQ